MTPKDPFFGGDFLGQILAVPSLPGAFVYSRNHIFGLAMPKCLTHDLRCVALRIGHRTLHPWKRHSKA